MDWIYDISVGSTIKAEVKLEFATVRTSMDEGNRKVWTELTHKRLRLLKVGEIIQDKT